MWHLVAVTLGHLLILLLALLGLRFTHRYLAGKFSHVGVH